MKRAFGVLLLWGLGSPAWAVDYLWNGTSGAWTDTTRWTPNGTPAANDSATIGAGNVTLDSPRTLAQLTLTGGNLRLNGQDLIVSGPMQWTGGVISGLGQAQDSLSSTGGLDLAGAANKGLTSVTLDCLQTCRWAGTGDIVLDQATLHVGPAASFLAQDDAEVLGIANANTGTVLNEGTWRKESATGTTAVRVTFQSTGAVHVAAGTLSLETIGTGSGNFDVADGAALHFDAVQGFALEQGFTITGAGFAGITDVDAELSVNAAGTAQDFTLAAGVLQGTGDFTIQGVFDWSGGRIARAGKTIAAGLASIQGAAAKTLGAGTPTVLEIGGTATWTGTGDLGFQQGQILVRQGAVLDLQNDEPMVGVSASSAGNVLRNQGTLRKSVGTGKSVLQHVALDNEGTVDVQSGTLELRVGGTSSGLFQVAAGALVLFPAGRPVFAAGVASDGDGAVRIEADAQLTVQGASSLKNLELAGGFMTLNAALSITGLLDWTAGSVLGAGPLQVQGSAAIHGDNLKVLGPGAILSNSGTVTWSGAGALLLQGSVMVENLEGCSFHIEDASALNGQGSFVNSGILTRSAGSGTTTFSSGVTFTTSGSVELRSGSLALAGAYTQTAGQTLLAGGDLAANPVSIQGGVLAGGRTSRGGPPAGGTITGNLINAGLLAPGLPPGPSAGILRIDGNYTQTATGTLDIDILGVGPGTGFDQLLISGDATLDGTLQIDLVPPFAPTPGTVIPFLLSSQTLRSRGLSGEFAVINGLGLGGGLAGQIEYGAQDCSLVVVQAVPALSGVWLLMLAAMLTGIGATRGAAPSPAGLRPGPRGTLPMGR